MIYVSSSAWDYGIAWGASTSLSLRSEYLERGYLYCGNRVFNLVMACVYYSFYELIYSIYIYIYIYTIIYHYSKDFAKQRYNTPYLRNLINISMCLQLLAVVSKSLK